MVIFDGFKSEGKKDCLDIRLKVDVIVHVAEYLDEDRKKIEGFNTIELDFESVSKLNEVVYEEVYNELKRKGYDVVKNKEFGGVVPVGIPICFSNKKHDEYLRNKK